MQPPPPLSTQQQHFIASLYGTSNGNPQQSAQSMPDPNHHYLGAGPSSLIPLPSVPQDTPSSHYLPILHASIALLPTLPSATAQEACVGFYANVCALFARTQTSQSQPQPMLHTASVHAIPKTFPYNAMNFNNNNNDGNWLATQTPGQEQT